MVRTDISLYILLIFFTAHVGSACVSEVCQNCKNARGVLKDTGANITCSGDFSVRVNSTGSNAEEGQDVTLTCVHNFPDEFVIYTWLKDEKIMKDENKKELVLKGVLSSQAGKYICMVNSTCGCAESASQQVTVNSNPLVLILICGVSSVGLIVIMGLVMKFKLKRDNEKHRERRRQRAETGPAAGPNPPRTHS